MNKKHSILLMASSLIMALVSVQADAGQGIRVKCERRADRSVISVDGGNLDAGDYSALVISGSNAKPSNLPLKPAIGGQVEFDFSSQAADIAAGATTSGTTFVQSMVLGQILNSQGFVVSEATAICRVR